MDLPVPLVRLTDERGHLRPFEDIEREVIFRAIRHVGGNVCRAASGLAVGRSTIYRRLRAVRDE